MNLIISLFVIGVLVFLLGFAIILREAFGLICLEPLDEFGIPLAIGGFVLWVVIAIIFGSKKSGDR